MLNYILKNYEKFADLYFISGQKPKIKIEGIIKDITVSAKEKLLVTDKLIKSQILKYSDNENMFQSFFENKEGEMDFSIQVGLNRFRINLFKTTGGISRVLRLIPRKTPDFTELGLPLYLLELTKEKLGLVLVTGVTGSGKSTTLASLLNQINLEQEKHILTIEDPIEFRYKPVKSIISQREIGSHSKSFATALRAALREAPDVILVGEMRDKETIEIALRAAETGHLVLSTLHTYSAVQTIERILANFNGNEKELIKNSLATVLKCIISQKLVRTKDEKLELVYEIIYNDLSIANNIRQDKIQQIPNTAKSGNLANQQVLLNETLLEMVKMKKISRRTSLQLTYNKEDLIKQLDNYKL